MSIPGSGIYHPLFLPQDGQSSEDYPSCMPTMIGVVRIVGGQRVSIPEAFGPQDLPDEMALVERLGGGTYILTARDNDGRILAKRTYVFDGPPKTASAATPQLPQVAASAMGGGSSGDLLATVLNIMNVSAQQSRDMMMAMMQQQQQQNMQNTQILIATMGGTRAAASEANQTMANMMTGLLARAPSPATPTDTVKAASDMFDLVKKITPAASAGGETNWTEVIGAVVGGLTAMGQAAQAQQQPQPQPQQAQVIDVQPVNGAATPMPEHPQG